MNATRSALLLILFAALSFAPDANAQEDRRLELSGYVGAVSFDQSLGNTSNIFFSLSGQAGDVDFGQYFGFRASYAFTRNLAAEFSFGRGTNAFSFTANDREAGNVNLGEQFEATQLSYAGNLVFQFPTTAGVVPYGTVGVDQLRTEPDNPIADLGTISTIDINFGGGLKVFLASVFGVRFDVRYHVVSDHFAFAGLEESANNTEFSVGVIVRPF